jgi:hypothetical protein
LLSQPYRETTINIGRIAVRTLAAMDRDCALAAPHLVSDSARFTTGPIPRPNMAAFMP